MTAATERARAPDEADVIRQFEDALKDRGIITPGELITDGRLHRCDAIGRGGKGDAAYILHLDELPAGGFENHRDGIGWENWRPDIGRLLTPIEQEEGQRRVEAARTEREADNARRKAAAAARAEGILQEATEDCAGHPYLAHKGVQAHGVRLSRGSLVVAVRDIEGALHSLQFIRPDGSKKFLRGGRVKGCYFAIGEFGEVICIVEGFATGASVHVATGHAVAVAFDCGNLAAVAQAIRSKFPNARIVLCADDDYLNPDNPGITEARKAAALVAGLVAVPAFGPNRPEKATDLNDLAALAGPDAVRRCIEAAITGPSADSATASIKKTSHAADKPSQRDKLLIVSDRCQFWKCDEGFAHVTIPVNGHHEHHRVRSQRFREWLLVTAGREFPVEIAGRVRPGTFGKNALEDAQSACEAMAAATGTILAAPLRVTQLGERLYLDLGEPDWRAVEIGPGGWSIIDTAPVPILRTRRTRTLPVPVHGGSLAPLYDLLPIEGEDEKRLVTLWLLGALRPTGPYPILAASGEQGTGKSFVARVLRRLVDPCGDDIMQPPREDRDLIAAARSNHVLAFDNLSSVSGELADSLCRLATGGDLGGRMLYTDHESAAFAAQRPIVLNGIPDLVSRGDLASRSIFVRLAPMQRRRPEAELWSAFNAAAPGMLGALLDVLSAALANLPNVRLPDDSAPFRMADFALLAMAAEPALRWPVGAALDALRRNAREAGRLISDLDLVAIAIRGLIEREGIFIGLVSTLYTRINETVDLDTRRSPGWPRGSARFGEHLRRLAPALRDTGIDITERRSKIGMTLGIRLKTEGVGEALSLFKQLGKKEEGEGGAGEESVVNSEPISPTPPTPKTGNGGNTGVAPHPEGVGGVGATYTPQTQRALMV
jgi:phage/plasmid primase-like uncharacterized protein